MLLTPRLRKIGLVAHIVSSVGWLGAVIGFLALSIAGLTSHDAATIRGAYLAMNLTGAWVLVPLSFAALITGIIQALGTEWGLFRYYWVLVKFVLTVGATLLLLLHQFTAVAEAARIVSVATAAALPTAGRVGVQHVVDASLAILVLLAATALSIFKPWGRIAALRGETAGHESPARGSRPIQWIMALVVLLAAVLAVVHLMGGGLHHGDGYLGSREGSQSRPAATERRATRVPFPADSR